MVSDPNTPEFSTGSRPEATQSGNDKSSRSSGDSEARSLQQVLTVLRRRSKLVSQVTIASVIAASALTVISPPKYTGKFRLLVEPVTEGSRLADSLTLDTLQTGQSIARGFNQAESLDYTSQIEVLKSEKLLDPTLQRIQARYPNLDYKELMRRLKIARPKDSKVLEFSYASRDRAEIKFVLEELSQAYLRYSVSDRKTNLDRGVEFVDGQIRHQRQEVTKLEQELEQFRRQNSLIDPDNVTKAMSEQLREIVRAQADNRIRSAAAQTRYTLLQRQMAQTPEQAVSTATLSEAPNYQNLLAKLRDIESQIAIESARFRQGTPMLNLLQDRRQQLLPLIQAEAQRVVGTSIDSANPGFQGTVARDLTKQYVEAASQVQVLQTEGQGIDRAVNQFQQQTQQLAGVTREYGQITRDLNIATASLGRLLTARENLQLESTRQASPWQMISKLDDQNIERKVSLVLVLVAGIVASFIVGVVAALLAERFDRAVHSIEELKETHLPCLGAIPFYPELDPDSSLIDRSQMVQGDVPTLHRPQPERRYARFLEAFYSLDANIRLLGSDVPIRAITISSSGVAEGKSTIAAHLAWTAATMGQRVLLIDTDLRCPQVHRWFGIPNVQGLTTAISSDVDVRDLIQESPQDTNLFLLPAGAIPPAPGRLLGSKKMQRLMGQLREQFDLIICDAPPLLGIADAKLVAASTDGILLTVGLGKTDRSDFMHMIDELRGATPVPILGLVANGLKHHTISPYYDYPREQSPSVPRSLISIGRQSDRF